MATAPSLHPPSVIMNERYILSLPYSTKPQLCLTGHLVYVQHRPLINRPTAALTPFLTIAFVADGHSATHAWARSLESGLDMGAVNHFEGIVERICNTTARYREVVGFGVSCGVRACESEIAEKREGEGGEVLEVSVSEWCRRW
jgi:hypothetical protein